MKATLVIDEMPSCCLACPMHDRSDYADGCLAVNRRHSNGQYIEKREEWCPLRPMPEQMSWGHTADYIEGYNACLEEIMGERT